MNDEGEYRRYGDPTILEPIVEQQDDEVKTFLEKKLSVILKFSYRR